MQISYPNLLHAQVSVDAHPAIVNDAGKCFASFVANTPSLRDRGATRLASLRKRKPCAELVPSVRAIIKSSPKLRFIGIAGVDMPYPKLYSEADARGVETFAFSISDHEVLQDPALSPRYKWLQFAELGRGRATSIRGGGGHSLVAMYWHLDFLRAKTTGIRA